MNIKFIAAGAGLTALGAAWGWAITADRADQKIARLEKDVEALIEVNRPLTRENIDLRYEVNDLKEENENLHTAVDQHTGFAEEETSESDSENSPGEETPENVSTPEIEEAHVETEDERLDRENDSAREDLQRMIAQYKPEQVEVRVIEEENAGPVVASTKYDPPFVISQPDYAWGEEGINYAKTTLKYYPKEQTLLDEIEDVVDDVERYVGWRSLQQFGGDSGDENIVFVRNRRLETDFEVVRVTDEEIPLHVRYGMPEIEFRSQKAAGKLKLSEEDMG